MKNKLEEIYKIKKCLHCDKDLTLGLNIHIKYDYGICSDNATLFKNGLCIEKEAEYVDSQLSIYGISFQFIKYDTDKHELHFENFKDSTFKKAKIVLKYDINSLYGEFEYLVFIDDQWYCNLGYKDFIVTIYNECYKNKEYSEDECRLDHHFSVWAQRADHFVVDYEGATDNKRFNLQFDNPENSIFVCNDLNNEEDGVILDTTENFQPLTLEDLKLSNSDLLKKINFLLTYI